MGGEARVWVEGGSRAHRGRGMPSRSRRLAGERESRRPGVPADRHLGVGEPLPGDPGGQGRKCLRPGNRENLRHRPPRPGGCDVPLRQPGVRPPGGDRLSPGLPRGDAGEARLPCPRSGAGVRPFPLSGGAGLLRSHEMRRQHVLRQPAGHPPPDPRGILRGVRKRPEGPRDAPGLRRLAQHGQAGAARLRGETAGTARPPEGGHPGVRSRDAGAPRDLSEDRASR